VTPLAWFRIPQVGPVSLSREWRVEPTRLLPRRERPGINWTAFEFLRVFDRTRLECLEELLRQPDEPCLKRGRALRYDGAPDRFRRWLTIRMRAIQARELMQLVFADGALKDGADGIQPV
jgi:hypothetical protein